MTKMLFMLQNKFLNGNVEISHYCLSHIIHFYYLTWFIEGAGLQYLKCWVDEQDTVYYWEENRAKRYITNDISESWRRPQHRKNGWH